MKTLIEDFVAKFQKKHNPIVRFVTVKKRGRNIRKGCVIAFVEKGKIRRGWSMCSPEDKFSSTWAITEAINKARSDEKFEIPHTIASALKWLETRIDARWNVDGTTKPQKKVKTKAEKKVGRINKMIDKQFAVLVNDILKKANKLDYQDTAIAAMKKIVSKV